MVWTKILNFLTLVFLNTSSDSLFFISASALYLVGLWGVFKKCGVEGWWALIPCAREAQLGRVANRAAEGRAVAVGLGINILIGGVQIFMQDGVRENSSVLTLIDVVQVVLLLVVFIYHIRVYVGLTETFGRKKRWAALWVLADTVCALMWGWMKIFQPLWKAEDLDSEASTFFSGARAAVLDQGLTVNLEERTATEMFKKKYLLRDIHMYIKPGRMVLLLGGSGAGKTTFLNAVNGYEKAKAEVMLNGSNMYRDYKNMKYDIGFVPQMDLMRGSDSVLRTLMDAATLRLPKSFTKAERQSRVEEVMKIFGLTPVKNNLVSKLSGGQRKRLSIAMEFVSNPTLFILDEPDSGLDGVMARELFQQLRQIADQGKIIIVITHTPDRVIDLFDDVIVLAKDTNRTGRLAFFGPIEEARTFFGKARMEEIVKSVNREEEGGEGRADEFIRKFAEVQHG